ncbi:hypothetical protein EAG_15984 [Camponotus floridanus]|uniref:Uncharacterized protein n=1 Tax=Camponotus floridanus TaxID=104421 RepID=E2A340_CAMFO|nr:hypothetical protein EAG_15984 [Camponotus floridanus]
MTSPNHCGYFADLNIDFILRRQISKILSFVCSRRNEWAGDLEFQVNSYDCLSGSGCETFYAEILRLMRVGKCCLLENNIDFAPSMNDLSFENREVYKAIVLFFRSRRINPCRGRRCVRELTWPRGRYTRALMDAMDDNDFLPTIFTNGIAPGSGSADDIASRHPSRFLSDNVAFKTVY